MRWLISGCSGLGDTILKIPILRTLRELDSSAVIDILTFQDREMDQLLRCSPWVNEVYTISSEDSGWKKAQFFLNLRKHEYQALFLSYEAAHTYLIWGSYLAGIKVRVMHHGRTQNSIRNRIRQTLAPLLPHTHLVPLKEARHKIDLNFDLLEAYFQTKIERDYTTPLHQTPEAFPLHHFGLTHKRYMVFQPGAARGMSTPKTWAPHNFVQLIHQLKERWPDLAMVTVGDRGDAEVSQTLQKELPFLVNTAGLTTLSELKSLLEYACIVVCHDSGVMHLANALDVDLIALYGPTDDSCTRPLGSKSQLIFSNNECRRLMYNWRSAEHEIIKKYPMHYCLSAISVDQVYRAVVDRLAQSCP